MTDKIKTLTIPRETATIIIKRLVPIAKNAYSPDGDTGSILRAINIQVKEGKLLMCATDGSRLVAFEDDAPEVAPDYCNWNVPSSLFYWLDKGWKRPRKDSRGRSTASQVTLEVKNNSRITIYADDIEAGGRLINGEYPKYQQLIPEACEFELSFNPTYFADACKNAEQPITLYHDGHLKPVVFRDADKRVAHLLMPVQAKDSKQNKPPAHIIEDLRNHNTALRKELAELSEKLLAVNAKQFELTKQGQES